MKLLSEFFVERPHCRAELVEFVAFSSFNVDDLQQAVKEIEENLQILADGGTLSGGK